MVAFSGQKNTTHLTNFAFAAAMIFRHADIMSCYTSLIASRDGTVRRKNCATGDCSTPRQQQPTTHRGGVRLHQPRQQPYLGVSPRRPLEQIAHLLGLTFPPTPIRNVGGAGRASRRIAQVSAVKVGTVFAGLAGRHDPCRRKRLEAARPPTSENQLLAEQAAFHRHRRRRRPRCCRPTTTQQQV